MLLVFIIPCKYKSRSIILPTAVLIWEPFFILTRIIFLVDVLSNYDYQRSNLSRAHRTHITHAQTYVNEINGFQKHGSGITIT